MKIRITVTLDTARNKYNEHSHNWNVAQARQVYTDILEEALYYERQTPGVVIAVAEDDIEQR